MSTPTPERKQHSMTGSKYFLSIHNMTRSQQTAFAFGDLTEITFIARRRIAEMNGGSDAMSVRLVEISADEIGSLTDDNEPTIVKREVTTFEGDADTAALVLKRRLAAERKQQSEQESEQLSEPTALGNFDRADMAGEQDAAQRD